MPGAGYQTADHAGISARTADLMAADANSAAAFFTGVPVICTAALSVGQGMLPFFLRFADLTDPVVVMAVAEKPQTELVLSGGGNFRFSGGVALGAGLFLQALILTVCLPDDLIPAPIVLELIVFSANAAHCAVVGIVHLFPVSELVVTTVLTAIDYLIGAGIIAVAAFGAFVVFLMGMGRVSALNIAVAAAVRRAAVAAALIIG